MPKPKLASIVVLNLNGQRHLAPLLAHLAEQTVRDFELVFVDNGSDDDSVALVSQTCRSFGIDLCLIRNTQNMGFAPACNQGLRAAHSEWIVMLNNDTRPESRWLEQLLLAGDIGQRVGMVASKMLRAHQPERGSTRPASPSTGLELPGIYTAASMMIRRIAVCVKSSALAAARRCMHGACCWNWTALTPTSLPILRTSTWPGAPGSLVGAVSTSRPPCAPRPLLHLGRRLRL